MTVFVLFISCTIFSFATDMLTKRILQTANAPDSLALGMPSSLILPATKYPMPR
jgi:hypothetical protein